MTSSTAREPRLTGGAVLVFVAAVVVVVAVTTTTVRWTTGEPLSGVVLAFALLIAVGELLRVTLPGDRDAAPVGTALALAMAFVPEVGSTPADYGAAAVLTATAVGTALGVLPHAAAGRAPRLEVLARRVLVIAVAAVLFRSIPLVEGQTLAVAALDWDEHRWVLAAAALGVGAVATAVDVVLAALVRAEAELGRLAPFVTDELRATLGIGAAVAATGVLVAVAARPMGVLALPVFAVPLLLAQFAYKRYAVVRSTYRQTIRSLSRLTELGGYTETGHSQRVAALAVAIGRDLGLPERELHDLEYAALMHDIGQLSLTDPIPGGATTVADTGEQRRIASLGADIVRQTGVLDRVADLVQHQADPYRRPYEHDAEGDDGVPVGSRIIRVANAYDDLVGDVPCRSRQMEALDRLHLGLAFEYDPRVVNALHRVVSRQVR